MANIQSPEFWVLVLPIRVWSESSLSAHATLLVLSWGGSNVLYQHFFISKSTVREWSFAPGFCPFYGTWWGILSKLYFVYLGTSWRILSKLYFVYLLSTFLINFAHLDLNQSFLRNWHSTNTFFLAMCWGGGVRTGTFFLAYTTRLQAEHLGQVLKKSDQWSWRRCDNEIVTVLSNEQFTTLFLIKRNHFRADTAIHWKEFICKVSTKFL